MRFSCSNQHLSLIQFLVITLLFVYHFCQLFVRYYSLHKNISYRWFLSFACHNFIGHWHKLKIGNAFKATPWLMTLLFLWLPILYNWENKKSKLMLMRCVRAYRPSSFCRRSQIILVYLYPSCCSSLFCSRKLPKMIKTLVYGFKVI